MKEVKELKNVKKESVLMSIMPLKDFVICCNEYKYDIKKGVEIEVHKMFLQNLKTENVIK